MSLLETVLTVLTAGLLLTIVVLLIRASSAKMAPVTGDTPVPAPLIARIDELAELLNGLKSRQKEVEGEWEVYYAKMRKLAGKAYREDQVADGKHKGAPEEPDPVMTQSPEQWKVMMQRRKHGIA